MLDLERLADQLPAFRDHRRAATAQAADRLARALDALAACEDCWESLRAKAERLERQVLVARLREAPGAVRPPEPRPTPVTVVATDGSQVFPDRHREPHCYLLNVARLAFQYGTHERPLVEAVPTLGYDADALADLVDALEPDPSAETVSALRDELELKALLETARAARVEGRPLVALADGTLIRWMLRGMRDRARADAFVARYAALLEGFRADGLPVASYVSLPASTEVVNLLRVHLGEYDGGGDPAASLDGLVDRWVFERTLRPGERSALFESSSRIDYAAADRICFFYVRVPGEEGVPDEVARVELPRWVADDAALVDLVHAVVLSESGKGGGYPMILAEAHERAVIRQREKEAFFALVDHTIGGPGQPPLLSRKAASKRTPQG